MGQSSGSLVHDFSESLKASHAAADEPFWLDVYRKAFPGLLSAVSVRDDGWAQRGGMDTVLHGNSTRGERNAQAKLTETDIRRIFDLRESGRTQQQIAAQIGCCRALVGLVLSGQRWMHLGLYR